jgi:hypothetical protein
VFNAWILSCIIHAGYNIIFNNRVYDMAISLIVGLMHVLFNIRKLKRRAFSVLGRVGVWAIYGDCILSENHSNLLYVLNSSIGFSPAEIAETW